MTDTEPKQMQIVDSYLALNALREVGYRNTATAIAELVDNSIEAEADDIFIITQSQMEQGKKNLSYRVKQIAVLDNGDGMAPDDLANCLSLGWGTRLDTRQGLGRFGFGLKGASISQARKIEVYSWQSDKCYRTYLDLDEVRDNKQQLLHPAEVCKTPRLYSEREEFRELINNKSGTLVVWSKLDGIDFTRPNTLLNRMNKELCRLYRHFLDDDDTYGRKRNIVMCDYDLGKSKIKNFTKLAANDPLYLLEPSNAPGTDGKATNVPFEKPYSIDVKYAPGKSSKIEIRLSIAKPGIQALSGNSVLGKHYGQNAGISFVRAGREIDFGPFGFIHPSEPRNRWWGLKSDFLLNSTNYLELRTISNKFVVFGS
ncbi:MAG: ATP-binding protein [Hyphomonadaceae bacterium]|nr:ATP-binding protein [Hyphomonadaceae bacterium]